MANDINFGTQYNLNFNNMDYLAPVRPQSQALGGDFNQILSDLFKGLSNFFEGLGNGQFSGGGNSSPSCGCTSPPYIPESSHPSGTLKAGDGKVTTPGGYTVEPMGKFEWKITGPDGKSTRIWGDPHVAESDGGKWDFKRNSTFMLPDGTRINVTTAPWKGGKMTVTSGLEIINGNDRVMISDIDKGKGKIGPVTADGFAHANSFNGNDVFVMGKETDDWSHQGREIMGSRNGGESFKYGDQLAPGVANNTGGLNQMGDIISRFLDELMGRWNPNANRIPQPPFADNPYGGGQGDPFGNDQQFDGNMHRRQMQQAFRALSDLFDALSRLAGMGDTMFANRTRSIAV